MACDVCGKPYEPHTYTYTGRVRQVYVRSCACKEARNVRQEAEDRAVALRHFSISAAGYRHMTLANWRDNGIESAVHEYMKNVRKGEAGCWLMLFGPYGTGKTHMAVAIIRQLFLDRNWTPGIIRWAEFCSRIQQGWQDRSVSSDWTTAYSAGILVIDDLDKKMPTAWALGQLFEVLDYRYIHRCPTICTANRPLRELNSLWGAENLRDLKDAIISRMAEMATGIEFKGDDYRFRRRSAC